jgi:hypothetical protein
MQTDIDIEKLKYPVGKYVAPTAFNTEEVKHFIRELEILPVFLEHTVKDIPVNQLGYCYRPGGWNIKQIVHHVADSHLNFHIRLRLALTEETPTVKPYDENTWAVLPDAVNDDLSSSLSIIKGVHKRAADLLKTLSDKDFSREYFHPEYDKKFNLLWLTSMYAWHGKHHTEQIKTALEHKF